MEYFFTFALLVTFFITVVGLVVIASIQKKKSGTGVFDDDTFLASGINQHYLKKLIINHARRLQKLKEKQALYGLDAPAHLLTEIEDIEGEIAQLQMALVTLSGLASLIGSGDEQVKETDN